MAMYPVTLSSIEQVASLYNNIKPVNSAKHRGKDTRPIASRARSWERVGKVSDNHYYLALYDEWYGTIHRPIEWIDDTCIIRNGRGESAHTSHYSFLSRFLPAGMDFFIRSGKQFIRVGGTDFYLPKVHNDEHLAFKLDNDKLKWVMQHTPYQIPRVRVDKVEKAKYKEGIKEFVEWAWTMLPLLNGQYKASYQESRDRCRQIGMSRTGVDGNKFMEVLCDKGNEHRLSIVCEYMSHIENTTRSEWDSSLRAWKTPTLFDDPKKFRSSMNSFINKFGMFTRVV